MTPVICKDGWEMRTQRFPDRKRTALVVQSKTDNKVYVLGYFNGSHAVEIFNGFLEGDIDVIVQDMSEEG